VDNLGWVDVLGMRYAVNEVLSFLEAEFSSGKFLFEDCLGPIDDFGLRISCHGEALLGSR
jgi:hypothetical protein